MNRNNWEKAELVEGQLLGVNKKGRSITIRVETGSTGDDNEPGLEVPILETFVYKVADPFSDRDFDEALKLLGHDVIVTVLDCGVVKVASDR